MRKENDDLYQNESMEIGSLENGKLGGLSETDRLVAAKQILLGIAILYVITIISYLFCAAQGTVLLEICKTVLPPLATLMIAFYFKDRT